MTGRGTALPLLFNFMNFKEIWNGKVFGRSDVDRNKDCSEGNTVFLLLSSGEIDKIPSIPGLEESLRHMSAARNAHVCKAEVRRDCLCGTVVTPRFTQQGERISFSYLIKKNRLVICDDSGAVHSLVRYLIHEKCRVDGRYGFARRIG